MAQDGRLGPKVDGHLFALLHSSCEPGELLQWLCDDDSIINIIIIRPVIN